MRAPLLGLPKPIYYLDIIRLTDLWEFFVAYSLSNNRKVEHFLCDAPLFTGNHYLTLKFEFMFRTLKNPGRGHLQC